MTVMKNTIKYLYVSMLMRITDGLSHQKMPLPDEPLVFKELNQLCCQQSCYLLRLYCTSGNQQFGMLVHRRSRELIIRWNVCHSYF